MRLIAYAASMLILFVGQVLGQNYVVTQTVGTTGPYELLESNTTIIMQAPGTAGDSLPDQMSGWNALPFAWAYYGVAVSGYYVSDNG